MNFMGLDPCHFFTLPSQGINALLKKTGKKVALFDNTQRDMYLMIESGKIGGISGTGSTRYVKLNNKYLPDFDPSKPSTYAMYIDANSLYAWAATQKLPIDSFEWMDETNFKNVDAYLKWVLRDDDGDCGYFLEVDATIPEELHDYFNDYCPFPENLEVTDDMLSNWQKETSDMYDTIKQKVSSGVKKLIPNLMDKKKYVVHFKLLKLWLELGCKVTKIHRVLKFRQEAWMKTFVEECATKRKNAKTEFEKDFYKLLPNASCYGKFLENVRKHIDIKLVNDEDKLKKLVNKPTLKSVPVKLNDNGLMMVDMAKPTVTLDKPIHVGVAILNLSKWLMYNLWYNTLKKKYGDKVKLIYTDTDSFIFVVETEDFYDDLKQDKNLSEKFDFSSYKEDHPLYST